MDFPWHSSSEVMIWACAERTEATPETGCNAARCSQSMRGAEKFDALKEARPRSTEPGLGGSGKRDVP